MENSTQSVEQDPAPVTVLVVDDETAFLKVARQILARAGIGCATAESALEALHILDSSPEMDVVLCDLRMPDIEGIDFMRQARERFSDRSWLQLIPVTGHATLDTAVSALRLEAADYLQKPVLPKSLVASVQAASRRARAIRAYHESAAVLPNEEYRRELATTARSFASQLGGVQPKRGQGEGEDGATPRAQQEMELLRLMLRLEHERCLVFGGAVAPEPSWEMLGELMMAALTDRQVSVTSLCLSSKHPITTALRRINDLVEEGLVARVPDPADRRRIYMELTPAGIARMRQLLETFSLWVGGPPAIHEPPRPEPAAD